MVNIANIYSTLGNPNSLIPLALKDCSQTAGMTASSFFTGKEEGEDRLIDEVGTQMIWLFGIPGFKWLFDKTIFKASGLDSKFDVRNLKDKDVFEKIKQYAPTEDVKTNIEKIGKNQHKFKNVALAKFFVSTALTIGTYIGLTKAKHKYTEDKIKKNLISEYNKNKDTKQKEENQNNTNPTFKGLGDVAKTFAFSPVKNMWILDGAITAERLYDSRTPQEFAGYAIKEGSLLFFMYYAGGKIQEYLEKRAKEKYNKTIGLDARVLENNLVKNSFDNGSIQKSLNEFAKVKNGSKAEIYEFLLKNPENDIVKVAKESDAIEMYKEPKAWYEIFNKSKKTNKVDTRKFIDLEEIKGIDNKLNELYKQYQDAIKNGETSEQFFKGVKKLKRNSINMNIGACVLALGVATPLVMLAKRYAGKDDKEFKTKTNIRNQLIQEGVIKE